MCNAAMQQLGADRLVLVPTYLPRHKSEGLLDFDVRAELAYAAFGGRAEVDRIERERGGDNFSYLVLPLLKQKYGDIIYLIGGDSLEFMPTWRHTEKIVEVCPIAVAARKGYADVEGQIARVKSMYGGTFLPVNFVGEDVSSSTIKAELLLGGSPTALPESVLSAIREKRLFENYADMLNKLKGFESEELFAHSKAVVMRAVDFNSKHNLAQSFEKVFLAALLHDNAKQRPSVDGLDVPSDCIGTPVLHQFLGAEKARRDFGVDDEDILNAIRYHTTAKADMTLFERLIYTADSLSDDRTYDPIPALREIAKEDFEAGFVATLRHTYEKLLAKGKGIYPLTVEAYKFYCKP